MWYYDVDSVVKPLETAILNWADLLHCLGEGKTIMVVADLRQHWKPTKDRLNNSPKHELLLIRIHRALSWMQRVEALPDDALDDRMIFQWVALNSLYGQWDSARREPQPDVVTLRAFLNHLLPLDEHGRIAAILKENRSQVMSIFEDAYLTKFFWEEPSESRAQRSMSKRHKANSWYLESQFGLILEELMLRIYVLRCQLVHGAATYGGNLNRSAIQRCAAMLNSLLPPFLLVVMDAGVNEPWGPLCYPPRPLGD